MSVFVDTSAFYAAADVDDRAHDRAVATLGAADRVVTSDHVVVETWGLVEHRLGYEAAEAWWRAVRDGASYVESVTAADLEVAFGIGRDFADQGFSIVDRTSFAVMLRLGLHRVASLDHHFAVFRFGPGRARAFELAD